VEYGYPIPVREFCEVSAYHRCTTHDFDVYLISLLFSL